MINLMVFAFQKLKQNKSE